MEYYRQAGKGDQSEVRRTVEMEREGKGREEKSEGRDEKGEGKGRKR